MSPTSPTSSRTRFSSGAASVVIATGVALPALSMLAPGGLRLYILLLFSGVGLATILFRSGNLTEWLGLSVAGSLIVFSFWTGTLWHLGLTGAWILLAAVLVMNLAAAAWLGIRRKRIAIRIGRFDLVVLVVWILVRTMQAIVFAKNGLHPDGSGETTFIARTWFGRDTLFLYALVSQAQGLHNWPQWNPFFGGHELAYPTLIHTGLAGLLQVSGSRIASASSWLLGITLVSIVANGLALVKSACRRARMGVLWPLAGAVLLYALAVRLDLVVYPQTQYFLLAIFLLFARVMLILGLRSSARDAGWICAAWLLAVFLLFAHQVSGTAALATWGIVGIVMLSTRRWRLRAAVFWAVSWGALVLLFLRGGTNLNLAPPSLVVDWPTVWTSLPGLRGWVPAILLTAWGLLALSRVRLLLWFALVLSAATPGFILWGAMQESPTARMLLTFNAERYLYHGFLLTFPLVAVLLTGYWHRCWDRPGLRAGIVILMVMPFFQLPALSYDARGLVTKVPVVTSREMLEAYDWIRENTEVGDVILRGPTQVAPTAQTIDRSLPAFTGRSIYLADAINSWAQTNIPDDEHFDRARFFQAAFAGLFGPELLARECERRRIELIVIEKSESTVEPENLFSGRWFEIPYSSGGVYILRPRGG